MARRHRLADGIGLNITKAYLSNAVYPTRKLANLYLCRDGLPVAKSPLFKGYQGAATEFENRDNRMLTTLAPNGAMVWNNTANNSRASWSDDDRKRALTVSVPTVAIRPTSGPWSGRWLTDMRAWTIR